MVVLIEIVLVSLFQEERVGRPGGIGAVAVTPQLHTAAVVFRHQTLVAIDKIGALRCAADVHILPQAPPERVVVIFGDDDVVDILPTPPAVCYSALNLPSLSSLDAGQTVFQASLSGYIAEWLNGLDAVTIFAGIRWTKLFRIE